MNKTILTAEKAIEILKKVGCSPEVIRHCKAVSNLAVKIARRCKRNGVDVDLDLVRIGALLHDIGRSRTHSVHHPIVGVEIAESLNLPEEIIKIIKRHLGGGLTSKEASELGWPSENYLPETIEEKIITYADKLVEGDKEISFEKALERFEKELGSIVKERLIKLHLEIQQLQK